MGWRGGGGGGGLRSPSPKSKFGKFSSIVLELLYEFLERFEIFSNCAGKHSKRDVTHVNLPSSIHTY